MQGQSVKVEKIGRRLYCKKCKKSWIPRTPQPVSCAKCKREINWSGIGENIDVSQTHEERQGNSLQKSGEISENEQVNHEEFAQEHEPGEDIGESEDDSSENVQFYDEEEDIEVGSKFDNSEELAQQEEHQGQMIPPELKFKDVDKLFQDSSQLKGKTPSEIKKDIPDIPEIPLPDLNEEEVEGLVGGVYNNENNRKRASSVLWEFLNRNKKNIQDRITSKLSDAAGGGAPLDPLLLDGFMTLATLLLMKFEENKEKNEKIEEKKKEIRKIEENLIKRESKQKKQISLYNIDPPDRLQELLFEKKERVYDTFEIEPSKEIKMKKEVRKETKEPVLNKKSDLKEIISDEEVEGIFNFFENIPEELLTQAIETQEDIAGGPYKLFVRQRIEELGHDQIERIKEIASFDDASLHYFIEELARKEKTGKMNLLRTKKGKEFLRINISSLKKILNI